MASAEVLCLWARLHMAQCLLTPAPVPKAKAGGQAMVPGLLFAAGWGTWSVLTRAGATCGAAPRVWHSCSAAWREAGNTGVCKLAAAEAPSTSCPRCYLPLPCCSMRAEWAQRRRQHTGWALHHPQGRGSAARGRAQLCKSAGAFSRVAALWLVLRFPCSAMATHPAPQLVLSLESIFSWFCSPKQIPWEPFLRGTAVLQKHIHRGWGCRVNVQLQKKRGKYSRAGAGIGAMLVSVPRSHTAVCYSLQQVHPFSSFFPLKIVLMFFFFFFSSLRHLLLHPCVKIWWYNQGRTAATPRGCNPALCWAPAQSQPVPAAVISAGGIKGISQLSGTGTNCKL